MAGVFCMVAPPGMPAAAAVARRLAALMTLFPWQCARVEEVGPGRVWLGAIVNDGAPAALDAALSVQGRAAAAVEGWFLRARQACGAEGEIAAGRHAAAALSAYRGCSDRFAGALEGQFNAIVYDGEARRIVAANSRVEHTPLYVWQGDDACLMSTSLGPMGACGLFTPRLDARAAATFLAYGQLFADQTLLEGVRVMDQASVLEWTVDEGRSRAVRYWDMGRIMPARDDLTLAQHAGELCDALRAAGRLAARRPGRYVVGLSGGLDSRLNLAAVAPHVDGLKAWTFGAPGASDLSTAGEICRLLGIEHLTYGIEPEAAPRNASDFVATVDGAVTAAFAYQLDRARDLRNRADIVLNGYAGEVIVRGHLVDLKEKDWVPWAKDRLGLGPRAPHPRAERNGTLADILMFLRRKSGRLSGLAGLTRPAAPLFDDLALPVLTKLRESVPTHLLIEAWSLETRGRRWTLMGVISDRHFYADGSVFYDYDFRDRCFATPVRIRRGGRLYPPLLRALHQGLAELPSGNTGLPVGASRARIVARRMAARLGGAGGGKTKSTGASPAAWTRGVLRDHYQELLADPRTRGRTWWDGEALAGRWRSHLAGEIDFSAELGLIETVELFARRWVDGTGG